MRQPNVPNIQPISDPDCAAARPGNGWAMRVGILLDEKEYPFGMLRMYPLGNPL